MARRIVVVGSSNTDMILKLDRIPRPGETILGGEFVTAAGGKGANQAVAAARAGGDVTMIARVGRDMFGDRAIDGMIEHGINVDHVTYDKSPSGVALAMLGQKAEAVAEATKGAGYTPLSKDQLNGAYYQHQLIRVLLLAGENDRALTLMEELVKIPYVLTPGYMRIDPNFASLKGHPRFEKLIQAAD
jgi:sugar/nucleoside kinase (ribokinase family)